jgi:hypothetical protein
MGMLVASDNGLYLLPRTHTSAGLLPPNVDSMSGSCVALVNECDLALWHRRLGRLNVRSLHAQHQNGAPFVPAMPSYVINLSCSFCNLYKATSAPRNRTASAKPRTPVRKFSCYLWGNVHVPSPYGLRFLCWSSTITHILCGLVFSSRRAKLALRWRLFCWTRGTSMPGFIPI